MLDSWPPDAGRPAVQWRRSGEDYLLVEYGPMVLDLELRFRVHALQQWLEESAPRGVIDITPGIRSLQVHFDADAVTTPEMLDLAPGRRRRAAADRRDDGCEPHRAPPAELGRPGNP